MSNYLDKKEYCSVEKMFLDVFTFGIKHHGKKLVLVDDEILRREFIAYIKKRKAVIVTPDARAEYGFYVGKTGDEFDKSDYSSLSLIRIFDCEMMETFENMPCFVATFKDAEMLDYWSDTEKNDVLWKYPMTECFLMNEELKPFFLNTFLVAEKEIDLICPWINRHVMNERMIELLHNAVSRGVVVKIMYGIGSGEGDERQKTSDTTVEMLKKRFAWTDKLKIKKGNTHIKYLLCDEKYMMCGSYNLLSFVADYEGEGVRDEGMEYIVDRNQIAKRRIQLFSWE